jgi:hypothetical protein
VVPPSYSRPKLSFAFILFGKYSALVPSEGMWTRRFSSVCRDWVMLVPSVSCGCFSMEDALNRMLARYRLCVVALVSTRGEAGLCYLDFKLMILVATIG